MEEKSKKKIEQKAILKIDELIDNIQYADGKLDKNDKNISWDGTIDFYNGNIDKKENYQFSIDVQVKGRTVYKKKFKEKSSIDIDVADIENYSSKDGTLLLVVEFKDNLEDYKVYYSDLLPYNIAHYLKSIENSTAKKIKIKIKELKDSKHLEKICRNFQINKSIQKRMTLQDLLNNNIIMNSDTISKFSVWENDANQFHPEKLVGTYQYIYHMDKNNYPVGISYSMITNMSKYLNKPVMTMNKSVIYNDLIFSKSTKSNKYSFGKAFSINSDEYKFNINICGSLNERLKQLKFVKCIVKDKAFLIGDYKFVLDDDMSSLDNMFKLDIKYNEFKNILKKHNIEKDINLDLWDEKDFNEFNIWMNAIEFKKPIKLNSETNLIGHKMIKDLKLSILASRNDEGLFNIESIWNYGKYDRHSFKLINDSMEFETRNIFLNLEEEAYLSDDINYDEMISVFSDYDLSKEEALLLNNQVLEILKAYDKVINEKLLDYALFLTNILLDKDKDLYDVYYINYCQILKRRKLLKKEEVEKLIELRNNSSKDEIKLCCNILIDNKKEADIILEKLDSETISVLKSYPIAIYMLD